MIRLNPYAFVTKRANVLKQELIREKGDKKRVVRINNYFLKNTFFNLINFADHAFSPKSNAIKCDKERQKNSLRKTRRRGKRMRWKQTKLNLNC
jgi:hypothetical protein